MTLELCPLTLREARSYVATHHRHNGPPHAWKFGVAVIDRRSAGGIVAVGVAGRPEARALDDGMTIEVIRVCSDGTDNACSKAYGALCRAAKALGYRHAISYTLASEPGTSLKAAGFEVEAVCTDERGWDRAKRPRQEVDLFGNEATPQEAKLRWGRRLA